MLILTRRPGESVLIGTDVKLIVLKVQGNQVRIGIAAPEGVSVDREEVRERKRKEGIRKHGGQTDAMGTSE